MRTKLLQILLLIAVIFFASGCYYDNEVDVYPFVNKPCDTTNVTYAQTIAPIMSANCNTCHNPASPNGNPAVITSTYEGLKVVADNGKLYNSVFWVDGKQNMPDGGSKLSDCDLQKIKIWLNAGAPNN
jgi:hypothetical protein